jgi:hypothetical protein
VHPLRGEAINKNAAPIHIGAADETFDPSGMIEPEVSVLFTFRQDQFNSVAVGLQRAGDICPIDGGHQTISRLQGVITR